uniref:Uncharacterized protein n=1 Tax=Picea glauca TaxID=3330 RepID=A0A124GMX1_PICGL|nr:hypothetical protein ABT39_MTgene6035 [Picea glauca]QHR86811.1 hypothetical protein Q903MT_gene818 [Picea sitchensis]
MLPLQLGFDLYLVVLYLYPDPGRETLLLNLLYLDLDLLVY